MIDVPGRPHPIEVIYRPGIARIEAAVREAQSDASARRCASCRARRENPPRGRPEVADGSTAARSRACRSTGALGPDEQDAAIAAVSEPARDSRHQHRRDDR